MSDAPLPAVSEIVPAPYSDRDVEIVPRVYTASDDSEAAMSSIPKVQCKPFQETGSPAKHDFARMMFDKLFQQHADHEWLAVPDAKKIRLPGGWKAWLPFITVVCAAILFTVGILQIVLKNRLVLSIINSMITATVVLSNMTLAFTTAAERASREYATRRYMRAHARLRTLGSVIEPTLEEELNKGWVDDSKFMASHNIATECRKQLSFAAREILVAIQADINAGGMAWELYGPESDREFICGERWRDQVLTSNFIFTSCRKSQDIQDFWSHKRTKEGKRILINKIQVTVAKWANKGFIWGSTLDEAPGWYRNYGNEKDNPSCRYEPMYKKEEKGTGPNGNPRLLLLTPLAAAAALVVSDSAAVAYNWNFESENTEKLDMDGQCHGTPRCRWVLLVHTKEIAMTHNKAVFI